MTDKAGDTNRPSIVPKAKTATGEEAGGTRLILRCYTIFNADQIDGLPDAFHAKPAADPITKTDDKARLFALFALLVRSPTTIN